MLKVFLVVTAFYIAEGQIQKRELLNVEQPSISECLKQVDEQLQATAKKLSELQPDYGELSAACAVAYNKGNPA